MSAHKRVPTADPASVESDSSHSALVLSVLSEDGRGQIFPLRAPGPLVVGRGLDADVKLPPDDDAMSRRHILVEKRPDGWHMSAIDNTCNLPLVNGYPCASSSLREGDTILLGQTRLRVNMGAPSDFCCFCCDQDLSGYANRDGRAFELADIAVYSCPEHLVRTPGMAVERIGKYDIYSVLGEGGAGIVYKAYDGMTCRVVALKRLRGTPAAGQRWDERTRIEQIRRIHLEMTELQSSRHHNIIRFVDADVDADGVPYLVTEFAPNGSLAELAEANAFRLPLPVVVELFIEILDGLKFLHSKRDIHRDIKPHNILLRRVKSSGRYVPKIADLGLVKKLGGIRITGQNEAAGALEFMPPEQVDSFTNVDKSADIYALGVSLYYVLTGRLPLELDGTPEAQHLACVRMRARIPVRERAPGLPGPLAAAVDRACHINKLERFPSAEDFQRVLSRLL